MTTYRTPTGLVHFRDEQPEGPRRHQLADKKPRKKRDSKIQEKIYDLATQLWRQHKEISSVILAPMLGLPTASLTSAMCLMEHSGLLQRVGRQSNYKHGGKPPILRPR